MVKLTIFNIFLLIAIAALLVIVKITVRTKKAKRIIFLISAVVTILFHYSSYLLLLIKGEGASDYLRSNPNLILPIYPCNVVMWSCLILPFLKEKSKFAEILTDYIFWFGIVSTLVGMFANVDFINNPTLADYDIAKSVIAHATLLFNLMMLPIFGKVKINLWRNMKNMFISVVGMYVIGLYCNLIFEIVGSPEKAYDVNSMFIIHSPFEGIDFLRYPIIALVALVLYFVVFFICDMIWNKKGERGFDKLTKKLKEKAEKN